MKRRKTYNKYSPLNSNDEKKAKVLNVGSGEGLRDALMKVASLGLAINSALPNGGYMDEIRDNDKEEE